MADSKDGRAMSGDQQPGPPRTLIQAHEALVRIRPKMNASQAAWQNYYERSVALYREIAEIDRGHHHEALYWAEREQEKATEIASRISAGQSQKTPLSETKGR
jgi:hypothetical protein